LKSDLGHQAFIEQACKTLGLELNDVKPLSTRQRGRSIVEARKLIAYVIRERWGLSYPAIARALRYREHTTVMKGVKRVEAAVRAKESWAIEGVARLEATR